MDMESAFASIFPVLCMMNTSAHGTGLACVCRIYILNGNTCQPCLIFYELCQSIERLCMQAVIVFTTLSCRRSDVMQLL